MALPGCLAELRVNFLADFAAYFLRVNFPQKRIRAKTRAQLHVHCRHKNPRAKT